MPEQPSSPPPPPNKWAEVKNNPIVIIAGACIATASLVSVFYTQYEIPHRTLELTRQIASLPDLEKKIAQQDLTITIERAANAQLRLQVLALSKDNAFSDDDPYPKPFRQVRIGDLFTKVDEVYGGKVRRDPDWPYASIEIDDNFLFRRVTFYPDVLNPTRVGSLMFDITEGEISARLTPLLCTLLDNSKAHDLKDCILKSGPADRVQLIKAQLAERFGDGTIDSKSRLQSTTWHVKGVDVVVENLGSLSIDKHR